MNHPFEEDYYRGYFPPASARGSSASVGLFLVIGVWLGWWLVRLLLKLIEAALYLLYLLLRLLWKTAGTLLR